MMTLLRAVRRRPWVDRAAAVEAWCLLAIGRAVVLVAPFRRIARRLGRPMEVTVRELAAPEVEASARVEWAVAAASARAPGPSTCLARAVAATLMLRRRGVPSTLYLGVARAPGGGIQSHAWVRSGARIVTGASEAERFTAIATFASGR